MLGTPASALADEPPGCPPGEWFCEDVAPGEPELEDSEPEPLPPEEEEGEPDGAPPEPYGEVELDVPPPANDRGWSEGSRGRALSPWGLALRIEGVMVDSRGDEARLAGVGVSGRYTLNPTITFDLGLDSILGTDYNGYDRSELSLSFSTLLFLNRSEIVRTYVLAGLNASSASVDVDGDDQTWGYFGGQVGLGLEFAVDPRVALNVDAIAFMRGRTDSRAAREPEFTDSSGRVTNTSGGGLLRGGLVLRF